MDLTWTRLALTELADAHDSIWTYDKKAADRWISQVAFMTRCLETTPQMGHLLRREGEYEFRQTIVGRYRFVYRVSKNVLQMRRVRHVRRDYNPATIRDGNRPVTLPSAPPP